jgi:predicted dehydrogenase
MAKRKLLLIGTGGWAAAHAKALADCREVALAGICGHRNVQRLNDLAAAHSVECTGLDLTSMLERVQPEIVDVSCNPHFRLDPVRAAVSCPSVALINLEKPLALRPGDAYEIARLCRESGKLLTVNHQKKFLPAWAKLKREIVNGTLGSLRWIRATCQGNPLEQGTHLVDMIMHFNDYSPIAWIMGQVGDLEGFDKPQASAPDSAVGVIEFENGVRALVTMGNVGADVPGETNKWQRFAVTAFGEKGHAEVTLNKHLTFIDYASGETRTQPSSWDNDYLSALTAHLDSLSDYIASPEAGHISDVDRSMLSFDAVMGIYASAAGAGKVAFPVRFEDGILAGLQARR